MFRDKIFFDKFFEMNFHFLHCIKSWNAGKHYGAQIFIAKMIFLYDCRIFHVQSIWSTNFQFFSESNVRVLEKCLDKVTIWADTFLSFLVDFDNFNDLSRLRLHIEERLFLKVFGKKLVFLLRIRDEDFLQKKEGRWSFLRRMAVLRELRVILKMTFDKIGIFYMIKVGHGGMVKVKSQMIGQFLNVEWFLVSHKFFELMVESRTAGIKFCLKCLRFNCLEKNSLNS